MVWSTAPTKRFFGLLIAIQQSVELQRWNWSLGRHSGAGSTANSTMLLPSRLTSGSERGDLPRAGLFQSAGARKAVRLGHSASRQKFYLISSLLSQSIESRFYELVHTLCFQFPRGCGARARSRNLTWARAMHRHTETCLLASYPPRRHRQIREGLLAHPWRRLERPRCNPRKGRSSPPVARSKRTLPAIFCRKPTAAHH